MNKVSPKNLKIQDIDSVIIKGRCDIGMTDKSISSYDRPIIQGETVNTLTEANQSHDNISIPIKEELNSKDGNSYQVSALVKFIKSSFSLNKKKPDINIGATQKTIISLRNNSQANLQSEVIISEDSVPTFIPSINSSSDISCRFCQEYEPENELVTPCLCSGTMKYIHQSCLQRWIKTQDNRFCELCKYEFHMKITTKPLKEWQRLEMSVIERRKIICSVTFHVIALTCVIWSLYVLIERTTEEMRDGRLDWPFWTKLIVVAIGFIGGIVFMYVQCRMYVTLCRKWHSFNRTFIVQSISSRERKVAQKNVKLKLETYQKNIHGLAKVYGDVSSDHNITNNLNNAMAPIATSSNEDLNYSFSTMSRFSINDSGTSESSNYKLGIVKVEGLQDINKHVM